MEQSPPDTEKKTRSSAGGHSFSTIPNGLLRYLEARGVLLSVEGQEAAQHLLRVVFLSVIAAIFGLSAWLLLMVSSVCYLAEKSGWTWVQATVAGGLVNLILASIFAFAAWRRLSAARWFEHTINEFGKDRKWLEQLK
ncbi:MAG: phage holin family protein [Verrucomicrobia bacterium]|nr:phage holin family protein [Verrucomicrobiota bacterium]